MFIIATVGTHGVDKERIKKMILAGADILRYNLSYYPLISSTNHLSTIHQAKEELNSNAKLLIDFPSNKIRLGDFDNHVFGVQENQELVMQSATYSSDCEEFLPVSTTNLGEQVHINQIICIANGRVSVQVSDILNKDAIKVKILNNGTIKARQTFNNGTYSDNTKMLSTYKNTVNTVIAHNPNYVAIPYIDEEFNTALKNQTEFQSLTRNSRVIIKIEKEITVAELDTVCNDDSYSMILIDRGELGVNMPFEKSGLYQKKIMAAAKKYSKPAIISTQILDSVSENFIPSRAEILDITNSVLDGAAGILLSKETSVSRRPIYAITTAKKIIDAVSRTLSYSYVQNNRI